MLETSVIFLWKIIVFRRYETTFSFITVIKIVLLSVCHSYGTRMFMAPRVQHKCTNGFRNLHLLIKRFLESISSEWSLEPSLNEFSSVLRLWRGFKRFQYSMILLFISLFYYSLFFEHVAAWIDFCWSNMYFTYCNCFKLNWNSFAICYEMTKFLV